MARRELPPNTVYDNEPASAGGSSRWRLVSNLIAASAIAAALAAGGYWLANRPNPPAIEIFIPTPTAAPPVVVDVAGEVRTPGVYTLPPGARVTDALAAAGGPTERGDVEAINRAALVADGERIEVPRAVIVENTATAGPATRRGVGARSEPTETPTAEAAPAETSEATPAIDAWPLDLNSATIEQLQQLPGIGPERARLIVNSRDVHGLYTSIDELLEIPGIGPATFKKIRDLVTVR